MSSGRGCRNDDFASNADYVPTTSPDPNNERSYDEAAELARQARCSPVELELAAGHIFGENGEVPTTAIVTHRNGGMLPGVFESTNVTLPPGTDPADATNLARPFEGPRATGRDMAEYQEDTDNDDADEATFSPTVDSDDDTPVRSRSNRTVNLEDDSDDDDSSDDDTPEWLM